MTEDQNNQLNYDQGNKSERVAAYRFNREILKAKPFYYGLWLDYVAPDKLEASESLLVRMREFIQGCNANYQSWGFKDPVSCLTYPIWASELPEHKIIAIYRSPIEIWQRYRMRRRFYNNPLRAWKFVNRWCEYNSSLLAAINKMNGADSILLSYRRLMTDQVEFDRLQKFVGYNLSDRREKKMWRNRPKKSFLFQTAWQLADLRAEPTPSEIVQQLAKVHYKQRKYMQDS
jgi:hypothetical protein